MVSGDFVAFVSDLFQEPPPSSPYRMLGYDEDDAFIEHASHMVDGKSRTPGPAKYRQHASASKFKVTLALKPNSVRTWEIMVEVLRPGRGFSWIVIRCMRRRT